MCLHPGYSLNIKSRMRIWMNVEENGDNFFAEIYLMIWLVSAWKCALLSNREPEKGPNVELKAMDKNGKWPAQN